MIIADDEEDSTVNKLISPYLLGRLNTNSSFNPTTMKLVLCNISKPSKGPVTRELDINLFTLQFFSAMDRDYVLNEGP